MITPDDNRTCAYCDITEKLYRLLKTAKDQPVTLTNDHVDPDKPLRGNQAWSCTRCNLVKNHTFNFEDMREIGQKYIKPMWKKIAEKKLEEIKLIEKYISEY